MICFLIWAISMALCMCCSDTLQRQQELTLLESDGMQATNLRAFLMSPCSVLSRAGSISADVKSQSMGWNLESLSLPSDLAFEEGRLPVSECWWKYTHRCTVCP